MRVSIDDFVEYLRIQRDTDTAKTYQHMLKGFEEYLRGQGKTLDDFTPLDVETYMAQLKPATANVFLASIRKYAKFRVSMALDMQEFYFESRRETALYNIRPRKITRKIRKQALTIEELEKLLELTKQDPKVYIATMFHFYFGMRPVEATISFVEGDIKWGDRYMIIRTAKTGHERILPWSREMDYYVSEWYSIADKIVSKRKRPQEWYTKHLKPYARAMSIEITAKTARKTFETQMRNLGIEQWKINFLLGHTVKVPDLYTDWTQILFELRKIIETKHYMRSILEGV